MADGKLDPVRLGLIWQRLNGIVDQVSETFVRAAFSTVVRDNYDMAFSLLDRAEVEVQVGVLRVHLQYRLGARHRCVRVRAYGDGPAH